MRVSGFGGAVALVGLTLAASVPLAAPAQARHHSYAGAAHATARTIYAGMAARHGYSTSFGHRYGGYAGSYGGYRSSGRLQCVPFARENTGIELSGNASTWWANAEGVYERGAKPEVGSVLNFRATGRMRMGHVAVVSDVVNARTVLVDHANWAGGVARDMQVIDVSPANDWTAVRVALPHTGEFGSIYPTYGFIYDRPDRGTMVANTGVTPTPVRAVNPAPADLRPTAERMQVALTTADEEVAEADDAAPGQALIRRVGHRYASAFGRPAFSRGSYARASYAHASYGRETFTHGSVRGVSPVRGHGGQRPAQVLPVRGTVLPHTRHHGRA